MNPFLPPNRTFRRMGGQVLLALAYAVTALACLYLAQPGTNATPLWVPTGLGLAVVLRYGAGVWPALAAGAFAANLVVLGQMGIPPAKLAGASLVTALANAGEAVAGAWLIRRFTGTRHPFNRVEHALQFILWGAGPATLVSAGVGALAFSLATGRWEHLRAAVGAWWLGDATGALVVTPLLLSIWERKWAGMPRGTLRDALLAGALILLFWFGVCPRMPALALVFFPIVVLGASRLGLFYASALVAGISVMATLSTLVGMGPLILQGPVDASLQLQQGFLATLAITSLVLVSTLMERRALADRLGVQNRLYRTLLEVNQALVHGGSREALLRDTCRLLVDPGGFRMAWVGSRDEASGRVRPEAWGGHVEGFLDGILIRWDDSPEGRGPWGAAIRQGRGVVCGDCLSDPSFLPWREAAAARSLRTFCTFPIMKGEAVWGVLTAVHSEANAVSGEDALLLGELAGDLGHALLAMETRLDLEESERRFRATLENVQLVAVSLDREGAVTFCNDHLLALTGWSREEVIGEDWYGRFVPPEVRGEVKSGLDASLHGGEARLHQENEILTRSGERRLIRWNNTLLRDREGDVLGTVGLGEDITDRRRAEQALVAYAADLERRVEERTASLRAANEELLLAAERAQAADRAKSAFLSSMSHELRTPLNSVIGFTGVLLGGIAGPLRPEQEEPLRIVQRNGRHLLDLINDVLDLSKIEAEEMRLASSPYDLARVVRECVESLGPTAMAKGLALEASLPPDPVPMTGDARRVAQIVLNLLSNAVKFTDAGAVTATLTSDPGKVRLAVRDTGPGIPAQDLPRLFREFEQLDVGLARHREGTGLGLALSRRLARLMGGNIQVASLEGQGSTFTLILPWKGQS